MLTTILPLSLAGLASAAPFTSRQVVPNYPETQLSKAFRLVANVTDPSKDFDPPVNNWVFNGIHTGAGFNDAVLFADGDSSGRVFYQNGTAEEIRYYEGSVLSDGGTPPFPFGIYVAAEDQTDADGYHDVSLNVGTGTKSVQLQHFPEIYPVLRGAGQGTYVACNQVVPYYNKEYVTIRWTYDIFDSETALYEHNIPDACIAIKLVAECATLNDLPEGSLSSHEYASNVNCYKDVSAIDWTKYGP
ncbi:hypothetical protein JX265_011244 [Neoarthrinium moseri]|uniref:DUF7907 domain-containing protein n=1 Tax=Neoarthrinium moseri TaxID=1658444 RepID=A0A9P9WCW5_9PEZI|nr:uncharacterized protein JN550_010550 [Neoarthrinium moseri]KAI1845861.1 hypothetical protein JX266_007948 [Neoarthrinium moseri]KAI1857509.1 hypothetical protein JX265_011244 [Neoarthrinium moseri]KAI1862085.1 hypothetical protein JN550_010550 [Neoarthrinium moseri]